jgi:hypothetical protein
MILMFALKEINQTDRPRGLVSTYSIGNMTVTVWAKTWADDF